MPTDMSPRPLLVVLRCPSSPTDTWKATPRAPANELCIINLLHSGKDMYTQTYGLIIIHNITKDISNFKVLIHTLKTIL